jgi:hypothetical protein
VLHHDDGVDAEDVGRQRQAAQHVVGDPAAGVADHMGLAEVQPEGGEDVDAGVHAGDDGEVAARSGIGDVGPRRGVAGVGGDEAVDLTHG